MPARLLPFLTLVVAVAVPTAASAQAPLARPLRSAASDVPGQVIVQFRPRLSAAARADARDAADVGVVRAMRRPGQQLLEVRAGQTVAEAIRELERNPRVLYAQANHIYRATALPNDPAFGQLWGQLNAGQAVYGTPGVAGTPGADTDATVAWNRSIGSRSIVVAVADTGIAYDHPDLAANIWNNPADPPNGFDDDGNGFVDDVHGADFIARDGDPRDFNEHGTHVAGTIGAVGNNGLGVAGMNWQVSLMAVRVLDAGGMGTSASVTEGFNYAGDHGARVVNASLGAAPPADPADLAAEQAAIDGHPHTLYVVAAGNDGEDNDGGTPHVPCNLPSANLVCVAATTQNDGLAGFSNVGTTSVDLGAPGTNILSTFPSYNGFRDDFEADNLNVKWVVQAPWGRTNSASGAGSFSVTDSPSGTYAPLVNASLRTAAPVPLNGVCRVAFDMRLDTQAGVDGVIIESSPDGTTWTARGGLSGSTGGRFLADSRDLPSGAPLFVRLRFVSDSTTQLDGAYFDNLRIGCIDAAYDGTEFGFLDGTSMATPQVAGAAALALALKPSTDVATLKAALLSSGDPLPALAGKTVTGRRLNVASLLNTIDPPPVTSTPTTPTPAPPPPMTLADVKVSRCKQSGSGKRRRLRCTLRNATVVRSARLTLKRGRTTIAKGTVKPKGGALALKLKHKLRKGRYTLSLVLRDAAGHTRKVTFRFRLT